MNTVTQLFGEGRELDSLQMCLRAIVVFIISLILIRISGRRAFGIRMPFDNVVTILLGAVLSRAITGASPFLPTIAAATTIVLLHRLCGWISLHNQKFGYLIKGETKVLYENGKLEKKNLKYGMISERDLMEGLHLGGNIDTLDKAKAIYLERNGQISVIRKEDDIKPGLNP
jgi:uncharacterized membrane protein YcaP (DUF421 family)